MVFEKEVFVHREGSDEQNSPEVVHVNFAKYFLLAHFLLWQDEED